MAESETRAWQKSQAVPREGDRKGQEKPAGLEVAQEAEGLRRRD